MNKTKSLVVALSICALSVAAVPVLAQGAPGGFQRGGPGGPGGRGGGRPDPVARMATELGLSVTQQAKIHKIFDSIMPQMRALPRGPESREKRQAIMKSVEPQIMAVLTQAQQHKVNAAGGLRGMMGRGRGGGGAGLFERSLSMMKLSPTEKSKTNAIVTEMRAKFSALRKGASGPPTVAEVGKMRELSNHYKAEIESALSPANRKEFEKISASRPGGGGQGRDPGQPGRS